MISKKFIKQITIFNDNNLQPKLKSPEIATNPKNFFPEDFFQNFSRPSKSRSPLPMTKRPVTRKITIKLTHPDKQKQRYSDLPSQENDVDSTNSGSMHFPLNNNKNGNDSSIECEKLKETPHFFPIVNNEEGRQLPKPKSTRGVRPPKEKEIVTLPKIIDEKIVNKEISNLFQNIPDDLVNDPDVKQKVNVLLNNIKEVKNVIFKKKNIQRKKNISSVYSKREINNTNVNNINESLIQQIKPYNYSKVHKVRGYANNN